MIRVSENGEGVSWVLLLLSLHAGVSTIKTGGLSWVLLSMLLYKEYQLRERVTNAERNTALNLQFASLFILHLLNKKWNYERA